MATTRPKRTVRPRQQMLPSPTPLGVWGAARVLTSKSTAAIQPVDSFVGLLLIATTGWHDRYDDDERRAMIDALPPEYRKYEEDTMTGHLRCPIDASMIVDNPAIKQAISKLRDEIQEGCHEVTWLVRANKASEQRRKGLFDEYLKQHAEELFGDENPARDASAAVDDDVTTSDGEWSDNVRKKANSKLRRGKTGHEMNQNGPAGE